MLLLPDNLKSVSISSEAKRFLQALKNRLPDTYTGIYGINLTGQVGDDHFILLSSKGLVILRFFESPFDFTNLPILCFFKTTFNLITKTVTDRLLTHSILKDEHGNLLFPIRTLYVFIKNESFDSIPAATPEYNNFISRCLRGSSWLLNTRKNAEVVFQNLLNEPDNQISSQHNPLSQGQIDTIINRLAPWCTIPKLPADAYTPPEKRQYGHSFEIKNVERNDSLVEILRLDPDQVDLVNTIKNGHQLILACAGSGKSAILIARCFKLASMDRSKNYLITCYNQNLKEYYKWQIDEAGLSGKNVECMTFHALCRKLIIEANISHVPDLDYLYSRAAEALASGRVKTRYYGIFIDEVQIFQPEWYQLCYKLLESPQSDEHIFAICGDITQDIRKTIKNRKAPWQGEGLPSYAGRTLHIEKNYRNCKPINEFINAYATTAMNYLSNIEGAVTQDTFLRGKAFRSGHAPELIQYTTKNVYTEAEEICKCIQKMHDEYKIGYTDIAILLYNQSAYYNKHPYNILGMLRVAMNAHKIPWTELSWKNSNGDNIITYQSRSGVSVMTYEGALGLDYRGVIVAGIPTVGAYSKANSLTRDTVVQKDEAMRQEYIQGFKSLYLACTRAKDALMIVVPAPSVFTSVYSQVLLDSYQLYTEEFNHEQD